jgi:CTD small phosphatase-like protein 2
MNPSGIDSGVPRHGGNEVARAHKLAIEVPSDDDELIEEVVQVTSTRARAGEEAARTVKSLPPVDPLQLNTKKVMLARRPGYEHLKTVVFDLDETLVHCLDDPNETADVRLPVTFPNGEVIEAGINIRPYAVDVLRSANKEFEVVVFTASHSCYADVVLDYLDPDHSLIHHRLYRENCIVVDNVHIKDLRIFANRRLQDIILVDNAAYSFGYQLDNGIPIISWHNNRRDKELLNLIEYLHSVASAEDVRLLNRKTFHLNTFYEDYLSEYLQTKALSPKNTQSR